MVSVPAPAPPSRSRRTEFLAALLALAVFACYANSLSSPFLFDDAGAVQHNPTLRRLWSLDALVPPRDGSTTTGRPLVNLSFALNYAAHGENAWGYRVGNVAIHAIAALLLFGLVRRALSAPRVPSRLARRATLIGFFSALLWALHPLQTESVTCIAQRTESLCGLFYLLTLYAFTRSTECHLTSDILLERACWRWRALSVVACLAGMATKEVMVTAPVLVWMFDRAFFAGRAAQAWRQRRGYYLALASTWLLLAALVIGTGGGRGAAAGFGLGVSSADYLLQQAEALVLYVRLALWPHPLVLDYGTTVASSIAAVWWQGVLILGALGATVWAQRRHALAGFLGAWFFLILAPSSSFVPLVTQTMAEHRMYLPIAPLLVALVLGAATVGGRFSPALLGVTAGAFAVTTVARNQDYRSGISIWTSSVAAYPHSARAHNNLAQALQEARRPVEAERHFARAVALDPVYVSARYNWGVALLDQGRWDDAIVQFTAALRLAPGHADAELNLGNCLVRTQRTAEAVRHLERSLQLRPAADAHYNLGLALIDLDRADAAAVHLRAALQLNSALPEAHYQLGRIAERAGRIEEATSAYTATLQHDAAHLGAHRRLGLLRARGEDLVRAAGHFEAILRLVPTDADAHANLGNVRLLQGQPREAAACYEASLRIRPNDARTRESLRLAREALR